MTYTERYVRADAAGGGDGTTDANSGGTGAFTLAEAITHAASNTGIRFNIKSGTYTLAADVLIPAASTESPNIWQGFSSTSADLFSVGRSSITGELVTTNFPLINGGSSYRITGVGSYNSFINLNVTQSADVATVTTTNSSAGVHVFRCRMANTASSGTSARAFLGGTGAIASLRDNDFINASSSAVSTLQQTTGDICNNRVWNTNVTPSSTSIGISLNGTGNACVGNIVFNVGRGIQIQTYCMIVNNSISNVEVAMFLNSLPQAVMFNICNAVSGYLYSGANVGNPFIFKNASTTPTSGRINTTTIGTIVEEIEGIALTGDPFVDSANRDFRLNDTIGAGRACKKLLPFWGSLADLGAVQSLNGGLGFINAMTGGFPE